MLVELSFSDKVIELFNWEAFYDLLSNNLAFLLSVY